MFHTERHREGLNALIMGLERFLGSKIGVVEVSACVMAEESTLCGVPNDLFLPFVVVHGDAPHLPYTSDRSLWAPEFLARLDRDLKVFEQSNRAGLVQHAEALLEWAQEHAF